jgi:hypothetical protein
MSRQGRQSYELTMLLVSRLWIHCTVSICGAAAGICSHGIETLVYIKGREFLEQLRTITISRGNRLYAVS